MLTKTERLKIHLMTDGMSLTPEARNALAGADESRPLTLADYASTSGISMELDGHIWVNVPIVDFNPNFVAEAPHRLNYCEGKFSVQSGDLEVGARPLPVPSYHDQKDEKGRRYTDFAITHTDRVRISPVQGCSIVCKFCDLPYKRRYERMPLDGLVGSIQRALDDPLLAASHVLISGGVPSDEDWEWENRVYETVAKFPVNVDIMMVPVPRHFDAQRLYDYGVHGLSVNLEMYDPELSRKIMPKKAAMSPKVWFDFIDGAVEIFGLGKIRSLLLVGIEPLETTLRAVEELAKRGCEPVLSPFRPDPATPMRDHPPPTVELLVEAYERSVEIVERHGVKLGPRCIPCMHNTLTFPDGSDYYYWSEDLVSSHARPASP